MNSGLSQARSASASLLLVDDDLMFCEVLAAALQRRGFDVSIAHGLVQAEAIVQGNTPDYAVVDLRLGKDSGLVLVKRLIALSEAVKIVVLTGYASIATAVEAIKLGAVHYLIKPADADEIVAALHGNAGDPAAQSWQRPMSIKRLEWEHLQRVLADCQGNISATARALGMHRRTLQRKLQKRPVRR